MGDMLRCSQCSTHHYRNDPCPDAVFIQKKQVRGSNVGQKVTYLAGHEHSVESNKHGVITSYNHKYVFVDFGTGVQAVQPDSLVWGHHN